MKKRKIDFKNVFAIILTGCFLVLFCISAFNIIDWYIDSKKTKDQLNKINDNVIINEISAIDSDGNHNKNDYWDFMKMNYLDVDFTKLKSINKDVKGWVQVKNTNINYPFVKASNNKFYLTHSFDKSYNPAGWVFLDYRNDINSLSKNTIIYAHGRYDKTMFGTLKNVLSSKWISDSSNHVIRLSTDNKNSLWQVFSIYHVPTTSDYLRTSFSSNSDYISFVNMLLKRSAYDFNTDVNKDDKIITLSTCYNKKEKMVLHAKLIKIDNKKSE